MNVTVANMETLGSAHMDSIPSAIDFDSFVAGAFYLIGQECIIGRMINCEIAETHVLTACQ